MSDTVEEYIVCDDCGRRFERFTAYAEHQNLTHGNVVKNVSL